MTDIQVSILNPTKADFMMQRMMQDASNSAAKHKLSKCKLDAMGYIKSHSGIMNDDQHVKRVKSQGQLAESIAKIKCFEHAAKEKKQGYMHAVQSQLAPAVVLKLADKGGDVAKQASREGARYH
jgi:hypothetical protein